MLEVKRGRAAPPSRARRCGRAAPRLSQALRTGRRPRGRRGSQPDTEGAPNVPGRRAARRFGHAPPPTPSVDRGSEAARSRGFAVGAVRGSARSRTSASPRRSETHTRPRPSVSVTLPRFTIASSRIRAARTRRTRSACTARFRTTRPGARTTTTTPILIRTATPALRCGRVVRSTSASWSPGSARAGRRDDTVSDLLPPARRTKWPGRTESHACAARVPPRGTILGRPRRSSAKPARPTSTTTELRPVFITRIVDRPAPSSETRDGVAVRASDGLVVPAPAEAGTSTTTARSRIPVRVTVRSP